MNPYSVFGPDLDEFDALMQTDGYDGSTLPDGSLNILFVNHEFRGFNLAPFQVANVLSRFETEQGGSGFYILAEDSSPHSPIIGAFADVHCKVPAGQSNPNVQTGFEAEVHAIGPGATDGLSVFFSYAENAGAGHVNILAGLQATGNQNNGGGTVDKNYGVYVQDQRGVGGTENVAVKIDDQGTGANDWAIKVEGGKSQLASPTFVGTLAAIYSGAGSPETIVTAKPGSLYLNTSGGAGTTLYVKESGTGNTGWIAK